MRNHRLTLRQGGRGPLRAIAAGVRRVGGGGGILLAALGLLLALGCGDDTGFDRRYAVSGTVSYKGKPVPQGTITFTPEAADGRVASGSIAEGRYSLTTLQPDDGAFPGKYRVTIMSKDSDAALASDPKAQKEEDPQRRALAVNKAAKSLIPAKYQLADTSGLTAEVQARSNRFDFELTD